MKKKVINLIILDESGSMQSIKDYVIRGFNEVIQTIQLAAKQEPSLEQWINFFSFNTGGLREMIPLSQVGNLTELNADNYLPDAGTPLYDAIGQTCNKLRKETERMENFSVLVTILTDGEENSSHEYDHAAVAALIKELKLKGWVFTYMGANHDVEKVAVSIHIQNSARFSPSAAGVNAMMSKESSSRSKLYMKLARNAPAEELNEGYFDEDKKEA